MNYSYIYKCPVCGGKLIKNVKTYNCINNHSYDIAKEGYLHLLPSNKMRSKLPGDNKEMVNARKAFLDGGYYEVLSDKINNLIFNLLKNINNPLILDSGCGEGYYTDRLYQYFANNNHTAQIIGFDISKTAVKLASKNNSSIDYIVASVNEIPLTDNSADCILNIFSPIDSPMYIRILKTKGYLILALPGIKHLQGMKKIIYNNPYDNEIKDYNFEGFSLIDRITLTASVNLPDNNTVNNLFMMTPYYYNTSPIDREKLQNIENLETIIEFDIVIYQAE